jgi:hypothetical protein
MKKEASEKVRKKILDLVRKKRVAFASDPKLLSRKGITKTTEELMAAPAFAEIRLESAWKKWRKGENGNNGGFMIRWGVQGIGFGEITIYLNRRGNLACRGEGMGKSFVKKALAALIDSAIWMG